METYMSKKGLKYRVRIRLSNGERISQSFDRKTDAKKWKQLREAEKMRGELGLITFEERSFKSVAEEWFTTKIVGSKARKTELNYRSDLNSSLLPHFGELNVLRVSMSHINGFIFECRKRDLNAKTINKKLVIFRQIMLFALENEYIRELPFKSSLMLETEDYEHDFFEKHEVLSLLKANVSEPIYPILFFVLHTGFRLGEVLGLCWDKVDFDANIIRVSRTMTSRRELRERTKTKTSRRSFPMSDHLRSFLLELKKRSEKGSKFVFTRSDGTPYSPDHFCERMFKPACRRAGLRELRFHDTRHTFASLFVKETGKLYELQQLLGHSRSDMTEVYAHLSPDYLRHVSEAIQFKVEGPEES